MIYASKKTGESSMPMNNPMWQPSEKRAAETRLADFMRCIGVGVDGERLDYDQLWQYSISDPETFWLELWKFCRVIGDPGSQILWQGAKNQLQEACFFPEGQINYAENLLKRVDENSDALIFYGEDGSHRRWDGATLQRKVAQIQSILKQEGIQAGDRVGAIVANTPEAIAAMLATASLGAVWSSCSPDFGVSGIQDRFSQVEPKLLFCTDGYFYNGRWYDFLPRAEQIVASMESVKQLFVLPYSGDECQGQVPGVAIKLGEGQETFPIEFHRAKFNDPLFIMFSSGTTGLPKCMVHGVGGALIQHLKEHQLHCDIRAGDRLMFFTTCGWMMWNWMVSALASGASLVLYDGSPLHPNLERLPDIVAKESVTHFGVSAKYVDTCAKAGVTPVETHDFSSLKTILTTGSPLSGESFEYIYAKWKRDICLSSISGGTDILGCFVGGCPIAPVFVGECQKRMLGMDVHIFNKTGESVTGKPGELVCLSPHPSMPIEFLNDADGEKYRKAYFDQFPNVWTQGDWAELTSNEGVIFYGRSDATLNVAGVRIGTSEIYRPVERIEEVFEALVIERTHNAYSELVLFVRLRDECDLSDDLETKIRNEIKLNASPRHVPAKIIAVPDIPRTRSGKIVELAVRHVVHGIPVKNLNALANPEALEFFKNLPD